MGQVERRSSLLELLDSASRASVGYLAARLGSTSPTIKRDLDALAELDILIRTPGGAMSKACSSFAVGEQNPPSAASVAIARAASNLVPRGAAVGLHGDHIAAMIARELVLRADDKRRPHAEPAFTVVTTTIDVAVQLASQPRITTVLTGGSTNAPSYEVTGPSVIEVLGSVVLEYAFVSAEVFERLHDEQEGIVHDSMARRANHAVVVAESGRLAAAHAGLAVLGSVRTVITDGDITPRVQHRLTASGYELIVAG